MAIHKILVRLERNKALAHLTFGDAIIYHDAAFESYVTRVQEGTVDPQALFALLRARLHRSVPLPELLRISHRLVDLLNEAPLVQDDLVFLCAGFPELLITVSQTALLNSSPVALDFLVAGLHEWIGLRHFSSTYSHLDVVQHICNFICSLAPQRPKDVVTLMAMLITQLEVGKPEEMLVTITMVRQMMHSLMASQQRGTHALGRALIDFIYRCKRTEALLDGTPLLQLIHCVGCPFHPLYSLVATHPIFDESEMIASLATVQTASHPLTKVAVFFALADYPHLRPEHESRLQEILDLECSAPAPSEPLHPPPMDTFVLLINSLTVGDCPRVVAEETLYVDFEQAYLVFVCAAEEILTAPSAQALRTLVKVTSAHPILAQRCLLLLSLCLKAGPERALIIEILSGMIRLSAIDEFCREKALSFLSIITASSYEMRCVAVPLFAKHVREHPQLFNLLSENLPPLFFADNAHREGSRAYAISIFRLVRSSERQSHLKFAFAAIQRSLKSTGRARDPCPPLIALLVRALGDLIKLQFIMWREFIKPLVSEADGPDLVGECCQVVGLLARMVPEHEEDYDQADEVLTEGIHFLLQNMRVFPAASLLALSRFPRTFLLSKQVDLNQCFLSAVAELDDRKSLESTEPWEAFIAAWVDQDVKNMSRSLFLGTSSAALTGRRDAKRTGDDEAIQGHSQLVDAKCALWNNNPIFAVIRLSRLSGDPDAYKTLFSQFTILPSLALQHWILRLFFVRRLASSLDAVLSRIEYAESFDGFVKDLMDSMQERMKGAQTVACLSHAILLWSLLASAATRHDSNEGRVLEAIRLLLLSGAAYDARFVANDEVLAALILGLHHLSASLHESERQRRAMVEIQSFLSTLATAPESWSWFVREYCFGGTKSWPALVHGSRQLRDEDDRFSSDLQALASATPASDNATLAAQAAHLQRTGPAAFPGVSSFILGRVMGRLDQDRAWSTEHLRMLTEPGPAIRKITACYSLAGYLETSNLDLDGARGIRQALAKGIESCTDQRLMTWLVLLLDEALAVPGGPGSPGAACETKRAVCNRFGADSAFGHCLDLLADDQLPPPLKDLILRGLSRAAVLPRMDWTALPLDQYPAFLGLALRHFVCEHNNQRHVNHSLLERIIQGAEEEDSSLLDTLSPTQLVTMADAALAIPSLAQRLLAMILATAQEGREDLLMALLELDWPQGPDYLLQQQQQQQQLLDACRHSNHPDLWVRVAKQRKNQTSIPESMRRIADLVPDMASPDPPGYNDIILLLKEEPERTPLFSRLLMDRRHVIQELSSLLLLYLEDSLDSSSVLAITNLMASILVLKGGSLVLSYVGDRRHRLLVAWRYFLQREPRSAEKLQRRLQKIVLLLDPNDPLRLMCDSN